MCIVYCETPLETSLFPSLDINIPSSIPPMETQNLTNRISGHRRGDTLAWGGLYVWQLSQFSASNSIRAC